MEKKIGLLMSVMTSHLSEVNYLSKTKAAGLAQNALARGPPAPARPLRGPVTDRLASRPGGEGPFSPGEDGRRRTFRTVCRRGGGL